jgi:hypothetical protein
MVIILFLGKIEFSFYLLESKKKLEIKIKLFIFFFFFKFYFNLFNNRIFIV